MMFSSVCLLAVLFSCGLSYPHRNITKRSIGAFRLPKGFHWYPWEMYKQKNQWRPNLINSWDRKTQDNPIANLLQTMIYYDDNGRPHKPLGINPAAKQSVKIAELDHHFLSSSGSSSRKKRNFDQNAVLWESKIVPYEIQGGFSAQMTNAIQEGFQIFHSLTCVEFVPRSSPKAAGLPYQNYLYLTRGNNNEGCASYIGRLTHTTSQPVTLQDPGCAQARIVVHELMHAIGQLHEQSRSDRDNYIDIFFSNIQQGQNNVNFQNNRPTFDRTPYDVESLMQYPLNAFSINGNPTMKLKDSRLEALVDTSQTLTHSDVQEITIAYQCAANCQSAPTCQNGGFVAHNCQCMCPADVTGSTCDQVVTDTGCGGIIDLTAGQQETIKSPNYPSPYSVDTECVWMIRGPTNSNIRLTIQELNLARNTQTSSCYHWLEIRYNLLGQTGVKECNPPSNQQFTTTDDGHKNIMILKFDSRLSKDQQPSQNQRFQLQVEAVSGSTSTNPCNPNPCQNSGTCSVSGSSYTCTCPSGWSGTNCDQAAQSCQPNPCQNGGTCQIFGGSYICNCPSQYTGANCEQSSQSCSPNPCQNGGTCYISGGSTYCDCSAVWPWYGQYCEKYSQLCSPNPCQNGGTCYIYGGSSYCDCSAVWPWYGQYCENYDWFGRK